MARIKQSTMMFGPKASVQEGLDQLDCRLIVFQMQVRLESKPVFCGMLHCKQHCKHLHITGRRMMLSMRYCSCPNAASDTKNYIQSPAPPSLTCLGPDTHIHTHTGRRSLQVWRGGDGRARLCGALCRKAQGGATTLMLPSYTCPCPAEHQSGLLQTAHSQAAAQPDAAAAGRK